MLPILYGSDSTLTIFTVSYPSHTKEQLFLVSAHHTQSYILLFLPKISNPSLLNFVDRIGFKMIPVEKYRKLQTEEKGIRKVFS